MQETDQTALVDCWRRSRRIPTIVKKGTNEDNRRLLFRKQDSAVQLEKLAARECRWPETVQLETEQLETEQPGRDRKAAIHVFSWHTDELNLRRDHHRRRQGRVLFKSRFGTTQNSPPFQRWVSDTIRSAKSRQGRHGIRDRIGKQIGRERRRLNGCTRIVKPAYPHREAGMCRP